MALGKSRLFSSQGSLNLRLAFERIASWKNLLESCQANVSVISRSSVSFFFPFFLDHLYLKRPLITGYSHQSRPIIFKCKIMITQTSTWMLSTLPCGKKRKIIYCFFMENYLKSSFKNILHEMVLVTKLSKRPMVFERHGYWNMLLAFVMFRLQYLWLVNLSNSLIRLSD